MARVTYTPVTFWLDMTPAQFTAWIRETNRAVKEEKAEMEKK
jgi:hypothetical protein